MSKIVIGSLPIKNLEVGNTQIKQVYSGSTLVWRSFHPVIETVEGLIILNVQGPGTSLRLPAYQWSTPPNEYFSHYSVNGETYFPGNTITFPTDLEAFLDLSGSVDDGQLQVPYIYLISSMYSESGEGGGELESFGQVVIVGFDITEWGERVPVIYHKDFEGVQGDIFEYTLVEIHNGQLPNFTSPEEGLRYVGVAKVTDIELLGLPEWSSSSSVEDGSLQCPELCSDTEIRTIQLPYNEEYRAVYEYGFTYFI